MLTYSGNSNPASIIMYLSLWPTSMQFIPISPSPPIGRMRSGGPCPFGGPGKGRFPRDFRLEPKWLVPSLDFLRRRRFLRNGLFAFLS